MPAPTAHFSNLVLNYQTLVATYLPNVNAGSIPTQKEQELARAFIVLSHAEIEFYFESLCEEIISHAENEFRAGRVAKSALGLITFSSSPAQNGGQLLISGSKQYPRKLSERFHASAQAHRKVCEGNNGIRQKYLAPMFVPLGLTDESIDPNWIVSIDAFAERRGAIAHKSMSHVEAQPKNINPRDVSKDVARIIFDDPKLKTAGGISAIESFDEWAANHIAGAGSLNKRVNSRHSGVLQRLLWSAINLVDRYEIWRRT